MSSPNPNSQAGKILGYLRKRPVCQSEIYKTDGVTHRLAARIHDLRRMGYRIESGPCTRHNHTSPMFDYWLDEEQDCRRCGEPTNTRWDGYCRECYRDLLYDAG